MRLAIITLTVFGCCVLESQAGFVTYTDRTTWQQGAGPLTGTENFNEFTTDTPFQTTTVAANNMTIAGTTGNDLNLTNKIDAPAFEFSGRYAVDGTSYLLGDLVNNETLSITFTKAVTAWGADFVGIGDSNGVVKPTRMDVYDTASVLIGSIAFSSDSTNSQPQFYGFTVTGDTVGRVVITNSDTNLNDNDVFGIDNIGFVTPTVVPEPSSLILCGVAGLVGLGYRQARRRRDA